VAGEQDGAALVHNRCGPRQNDAVDGFDVKIFFQPLEIQALECLPMARLERDDVDRCGGVFEQAAMVILNTCVNQMRC